MTGCRSFNYDQNPLGYAMKTAGIPAVFCYIDPVGTPVAIYAA